MDGTCGGLLCFLRHRRGILVQADVPPFKLADHSARCIVGELAGKLKDGEEESEAWGNESSRAEYEEEDGTSNDGRTSAIFADAPGPAVPAAPRHPPYLPHPLRNGTHLLPAVHLHDGVASAEDLLPRVGPPRGRMRMRGLAPQERLHGSSTLGALEHQPHVLRGRGCEGLRRAGDRSRRGCDDDGVCWEHRLEVCRRGGVGAP